MKLRNLAIFFKKPYARIACYFFLLSLPIAPLVTYTLSELSKSSVSEYYVLAGVRYWEESAGVVITLFLSFLATLALLTFKTKRARKKQKPGFDFDLQLVVKQSLAALGFGLIWLSLLPLPFLSQCIDLFTRKSFVHFTYWKPFGLHHILVDAPRHTSVYDINGFTCRDHLMASGWPIFWAFNVSLTLGAITVWAILKIRAKQANK